MRINNILVVSPMFKELQTIIQKEKLKKNFRFMAEEEFTQEDLVWADALVAFNLKSNIDYHHVQWVHSLGAGVDRFLFKKDWDESVLLTRTICSFGQRIAEYCLSYILKDLQFHDPFEELKQQKKWYPLTPKLLNEQKVMIYGTGEIGQTVAKVFANFGVEVYGVSLSGKEKEFFQEVMTVKAHYDRLSEMDYLINTLPLTELTEKLFKENIFHRLSEAGFINVGRGASLDENALLDALDHHYLRFAVLDVFTEEPLPEDHPLWAHPKVLITPHISAVTTPAEGAQCFLETLRNIEEGKPLHNKVNVKKGY
ncbi:D-2-hydroxyacid dehydrogenase [Bacillus thermocopriae]|uniref:D-2-hydroxyacid dehydrogenase n=1 Tax=Neobacillus thermocopriae TaxID=1215031 RepID=A0A6B3TSK3_9BACI|nr:D-2-hydroxyacid dehydrogenase [Neobacillus thermocopriae]NEX79488.1 D-2-hydroxyacid dehydrogenase [Neobacillus thermocopriae]